MILVNLVLRLAWVATLIPNNTISLYFSNYNLFELITISLEITRRFFWALIRIEFEIIANYEKLREYLAVPSVFWVKGKR